MVAEAIGGDAAVLGVRGDVIASSGALAADELATLAASIAGEGVVGGPLEGRALTLPVVGRDRVPAQAWIAGVCGGALGDFERLILQQASTVVALELMRVRIARDTERRLAGDVLAEALAGRLHPEELAARLRPFGLGEEVAVLAFSTAIRSPPSRCWTAPSRPPTSVRSSPSAARCCARSSTPAGVIRSTSRAACGRARGRARDRPRRGEPHGERPVAAARLPRGALRAGGGPLRERRRARRRLARDSAPFASCSRCRTTRRCARTATASSTASCSAIPTTLTSCCARSMPTSSTTAIGSARRAQVFCHRHTLRYRIRRVEELTNRSLANPARPDRVLARAARPGAGALSDGGGDRVAVLGASGTIAASDRA